MSVICLGFALMSNLVMNTGIPVGILGIYGDILFSCNRTYVVRVHHPATSLSSYDSHLAACWLMKFTGGNNN